MIFSNNAGYVLQWSLNINIKHVLEYVLFSWYLFYHTGAKIVGQ